VEGLGGEEDLDDQRRRSVVFYIAGLPSLDVVLVLVRLVNVQVEPAVHPLRVCFLGVGRRQLDPRLQDDQGGLCVVVLDDLVQPLHLARSVVRSLVLSRGRKVL
jgi:hypothetical protein